jgi:hypothetical protein
LLIVPILNLFWVVTVSQSKEELPAKKDSDISLARSFKGPSEMAEDVLFMVVKPSICMQPAPL